jgi:hypothetical protein
LQTLGADLDRMGNHENGEMGSWDRKRWEAGVDDGEHLVDWGGEERVVTCARMRLNF